MRGRTNTNLYSGITLNANIKEFEVVDPRVIAGNFVQYETKKSVEEIIHSDLKTVLETEIQNIRDDLYLLIFEGSLVLCKFIKDELDIIDRFEDDIISFCIYDDNYVFAVKNKDISSKPGVVSIKINDDSIEKIGEVIIENAKPSGVTKIMLDKNANEVFVNIYKSLIFFTILPDKNLNLLTSVDLSYTYNGYCKYIGNGVLLTLNSTSTTSAQNLYSSFTKYQIDFLNHTVNNLGTLGSKIYNISSEAFVFGDYFVISGSVSASSGGYYLFVINFQNMQGTYYNKIGDIVANFDDNKLLTVNSNSYFRIYEFSNETKTPILLSNDLKSMYCKIGIVNNGNICGIINNPSLIATYLSYDVGNYYLSEKVEINKVKNWDGKSMVIGVAKNDGVLGENIDVYIPSSDY